MKAFSIAVAVTLVLAFVSVLESATVPLAGVEEAKRVEEVEEVEGRINTPAAEHAGKRKVGVDVVSKKNPAATERQKQKKKSVGDGSGIQSLTFKLQTLEGLRCEGSGGRVKGKSIGA
ncbi:hypothetical protein CRUP_000869 [Coryphaenoides rupestris]|nr:hypothetical protein CRUP_000869 [Coryphaenoides rupestris]